MFDEKVLSANLNTVYKQHTQEDYKAGVEFYRLANQECNKLAQKYNITHQQACGIVSCLSPRLKWEFNIRAADRFLSGLRNVHTTTQVKKAERILTETDEKEIAKIINGEKTVSFYYNMLKFTDNSYVTIDRWMLRIVYGENKITVTDKNYKIIKDVFMKYAKKVKLTPIELQAITWHTARRLKLYNK